MKRLLLLTIFVMSAIWSSNAFADGYGGFWEIDDPATFRVVVSDASGISQAADTNVYWRVYEDETGTSLLNGTMTRIDSSNFAGFYTEQMTLSAANGFEVGKSYTFAAKAGVDGATGNYVQGFQVIDPDNFKAVITSLATAANLQTVDDNVDGVKAKTDNLTFTTANKVDARVDYVGTNAVTTPDDFKADVSNLDAAVSTRSTFDNTSDQVIVATNNDKTGYALTGSYLTETETNGLIERATGDIITEIGTLSIPTVNQIVAGIWAESLPGSFNSGEAGYILGTNLDATVSSRSDFDESANQVIVSTNNDKDDYTISGTKDTLDALNDISTANVLTQVASALATFWTSPATLVDLFFDEALSGHTTTGTAGKALSDASAAGDPWSTSLPGSYNAGEAGYIVGNNLNSAVGSVPTANQNRDALLGATINQTTLQTALEWMHVWAIGGFVKSGTTVTYTDSEDTEIFSIGIESATRTHAVAP